MRSDILERKQEILQWIEEGQSKAFICKQLRCKPETLNSYLDKMNIVYKGQQNWSKGKQLNFTYVPVEEYIQRTCVKSDVLRQKLIREGYKPDHCEQCGCKEWQGHLLPLELHHKDGDHFNNNLDNLMILCPNCHAIQSGNSGANIGAYTKPIKSQGKHQKYCIDCGKPISNDATRCIECYHKSTKNKFRIDLDDMQVTREELKELIRTKPFTEIAKMFAVTDNCIRKWCDKYQLPRRVLDIKQYSDEEWEKI